MGGGMDHICDNCGGYHMTVHCAAAARPAWTTTESSIGMFVPFTEYKVEDRDGLYRVLAQYLGDEVFAARFADCMELLRRKNSDYSKGIEKIDRIAGFRDIAKEQGLTMRQVWGVFFQKHMQAIRKFTRGGRLESEPIDGRINDAINYFVLLGAIIEDEKESDE